MYGRQGFRKIPYHTHAWPESLLFDFQVALEKGQFIAQRDFLGVGTFQSGPQHVAQPHDHPVGGFHVFVHERGD